jgi:hypothetical protein
MIWIETRGNRWGQPDDLFRRVALFQAPLYLLDQTRIVESARSAPSTYPLRGLGVGPLGLIAFGPSGTLNLPTDGGGVSIQAPGDHSPRCPDSYFYFDDLPLVHGKMLISRRRPPVVGYLKQRHLTVGQQRCDLYCSSD